MAQTLPVSTYVNVDVILTPAGAQAQNLSTMLIMADTPVLDPSRRFRTYATLTELAAEFGTTGDIYKSAALYFAQAPQPSQVAVGRWVAANAAGGLRCGPLNSAQQAISAWSDITNGSFRVAINGAAPINVTGLDFSAALNLSNVAATIQAATAGTTVSWNPTLARFEFTSTTTGATSSVSFLSTATASVGTDISGLLAGLSTSSGAYVFQGQVAETAVAALTTLDTDYGQQWYAVVVPAADYPTQILLSELVEGLENRHILGVSTQQGGCLVSGDTTNVAYLLKQAGRKKTLVQYSGNSAYAVSSLLGRAITTNFQGNNTVIDLMYKNEPGVVAENINSSQAAALKSFNCNAFVSVANGTTIIQWGDMSSGDPIDVITGTDWLAIALQNACYNLLYTSPTKVPQTDAGVNLLVSTCESVCVQAVTNGLLGPGVWQSSGFGLLNQNDFLAKGFYVYAAPLSAQPVADRGARKAPPIQIAAKLAGAFRTVDIAVTVNR